MNSEIIDAGRDTNSGYKVDVSRGTNVDHVSSEWFSRPDDERYLSLDGLFASVKGRAERSRTRTVESAAIRVEAHRDNPRYGLTNHRAEQIKTMQVANGRAELRSVNLQSAGQSIPIGGPLSWANPWTWSPFVPRGRMAVSATFDNFSGTLV